MYCAISGKEIQLQNLNYWNVDLQEVYYSPIEANKRFKLKKINSFPLLWSISDLDFLLSFFLKFHLVFGTVLFYL